MRKLPALAVATALSAVSALSGAEVILYGSARVSVDWAEEEDETGHTIDYWEIVDNASRLGIEGSEDLGNGLSAIFQYEFGVDVTGGSQYFSSNLPRWVGLKGGFGAVTLGTQYTPYYNVIGVNDFFNSARTYGSDIFLYPDANIREGKSLVYKTPELRGFSAEAMLIADGVNNKSDLDRWNAGIKYENGPFYGGLAYASFATSGPGADDTDLFGAALGYMGDPVNVVFTYEDGDASLTYGEAKSYLLLLSYAFGDTTLAGQYGRVDPDDAKDDVDYFVVGLGHSLSKRTHLWLEYIGRRDETGIAGGDQDAVSMGMRHDF